MSNPVKVPDTYVKPNSEKDKASPLDRKKNQDLSIRNLLKISLSNTRLWLIQLTNLQLLQNSVDTLLTMPIKERGTFIIFDKNNLELVSILSKT